MDKKKIIGLHAQRIEIIAAIAMGLLAVASFVLQALTLSDKTTQLETVLFNSIEFLLTLGFTWYSTRAITRSEFEDNLKRFAISAYRRIADIERMTGKLHGEVSNMIAESSSEETHNLRLVEAIISDTTQVVQSSIADWADVIGDELLTLEKIKRLEQDKEKLISRDYHADAKNTDIAEQNIAKTNINEQISRLISSLPTLLQVEALNRSTSTADKEHAAEWMFFSHRDEGGLRLTCVTGEEYTHNRDYKTLKVGEELHTVKTEKGAFNVADKDGAILGRLQNNSPLDYDEFINALELCYGTQSILLEVTELIEDEKRHEKLYGWFKTRVISEPKFENQRIKYLMSRKKKKVKTKKPPNKACT